MDDHPTQAPPPILDVSHLPDNAFDMRSPVWWGNTLMILIESTTIVLVLATYFCCWRNFEKWPPPNPNRLMSHDTLPSLGASTANLILIAGTCFAMYLTDKAARRLKDKPVIIGLMLMFIVAIVAIILRFYEFAGTKFRWSDNAYASIVWTLLGLHLTYLIMAAGEFFIMGIWTITHPLDAHHAHDITLAGGSWYWIAGTWIVIYFVIYIAPRLGS